MREADGQYMELWVKCNLLTVTATTLVTVILGVVAED